MRTRTRTRNQTRTRTRTSSVSLGRGKRARAGGRSEDNRPSADTLRPRKRRTIRICNLTVWVKREVWCLWAGDNSTEQGP
jgi:hypothetical protein